MPLANVELTNTFDEWRTRTNQLVVQGENLVIISNAAFHQANAAYAKANATTYTSNVVITVADNTNAALRITQTGTGPALRVEDAANPDSTPFIIDASGNVGVGTTTTTTKLTVLESSNTFSFSLLGNPTVSSYNSITYSGLAHNSLLVGSFLDAGSYSQTAISFAHAADLNRKFHIGTGNNSAFDATTRFSPLFTLIPSGNVGIGTINPTFTLQVVGTANIATSLTTPAITLAGTDMITRLNNVGSGANNYTNTRGDTVGLAANNYTNTRGDTVGAGANNYTNTRGNSVGLGANNYSDAIFAGLSISVTNALNAGNANTGNVYNQANAAYNRANTVANGKQTIWIPASAMTPRPTTGPASGTIQTASNGVLIRTLNYDTTTAEFAQFSVRMPKRWNESTISAAFSWSHDTAATNFGVSWILQGIAYSDTNALDVSFGSGIEISDVGGTANALYVTSETGSYTIENGAAENDLIMFQVSRNPANTSDNLAVDARLHGVTIFYTTNAATDD